MIPQIAHHPRNLSQQFGSPEFATPPFEPLQPPRIQDRRAPLPFRSPRNLPSSFTPVLQQRAYPVENCIGVAADGTSSQGFGRQHHDPAEHMLRRKTPNGTLAAGYDGTPVQWSIKAPASKHIVLPLSAVSSAQHAAPLGNAPDGHRERQRSNSLGHFNSPSSQLGGVDGIGDMRINTDPMNWSNVPSLSFTQHNVLDHLSMQQAATFYPNNGMQIPTVLQPGYQPSPGPTASNDGGFYGPYWPDGKFVPYRPAAIRDSGQHYPNFEFDLNNRFQQFHSNSPADVLRPLRQQCFNVDSAQTVGRPPFAISDNTPQMRDPGPMISHHSQPIFDGGIYSSFGDGARTPTAQTGNRASNSRFKEKTLSWAHSIYVDLLTYLHQSKRDNRQLKLSNGFRPYSKNSIYPKPPRHPTSHLAMGISDWSDPYPKSVESDSTGSRRPVATLLGSPCRTNSFSGWQSNGDFGEARHYRFSNQDAPHYVSPFRTPNPSPSSPLSKAREALEMLTNLCEQSGWCWIDGMLLGGCLAYGLEEYHKALEWYSKILALDSK